MADSLQSLIEQARLRGAQLSGAPRKELTKAIQQPGKKGQGKTITAAELRRGQKTFEKAGVPIIFPRLVVLMPLIS